MTNTVLCGKCEGVGYCGNEDDAIVRCGVCGGSGQLAPIRARFKELTGMWPLFEDDDEAIHETVCGPDGEEAPEWQTRPTVELPAIEDFTSEGLRRMGGSK